MLSFLGVMLFLLAAVDGACLLLGWPLTNYAWSPVIFATVGFLLVALEGLARDSSPSGRSGSPRQVRSPQRTPLLDDRNPALRATEGAAPASVTRR